MPLPSKNFYFVPSSTRIALSRFGYEVLVETPLGMRYLPASQIEGEVEWHIDLLRWHAKEIAGRAYLLPETHLENFYKEAYVQLCSSGEFTSAEAFLILEITKDVVPTVHESEFSRVQWGKFQDELAKDWRLLGERLAGFVAKEQAA